MNKSDYFSVKLKRSTVTHADGQVSHIRELTGSQRDEIVQSYVACQSKDDDGNIVQSMPKYWRETLFINGVTDENGVPLFTMDDLPEVAQIQPDFVEAVINEINQLSGLAADSEEEAAKKSVRAVK